MTYIVKRIGPGELDNKIISYIHLHLSVLTKLNGLPYNINNMPIGHLALRHLILVAYREDEPIGFMIGVLNPSIFDIKIKTLSQLVLSSEQPKATYELIRYFIDFGKANANLISMCVGKLTNLKEASLLKLGFTKGDTEYRMEV